MQLQVTAGANRVYRGSPKVVPPYSLSFAENFVFSLLID